MTKRFTLSSLLASALVLLVSSAFVAVQEQEKNPYECEGPYKGQTLSQEQLSSIVKAHEILLRIQKNGGERANLCGADLRKVQLQKATLFGAQLQGADLYEAQMQEIGLGFAELQGGPTWKGHSCMGPTCVGRSCRGSTCVGRNWMRSPSTTLMFRELCLN